jgi:hypothetical protein
VPYKSSIADTYSVDEADLIERIKIVTICG